MGLLTLTEFQTEILAGLGNRGDIPLPRISTALNLAQSRVARAYNFSEMALLSFAQMNFTGVQAVDKYLVPPPNLKNIHSFVLLDTSAGSASLGQSQKVTEKPWRWFDKQFPAPEWLAPGWPTIYARWGQVIVMVPTPQMQFTAQLRYIGYPRPFLSQANGNSNFMLQTSDFEYKDDILIAYSLAYLFESLGRPDRAQYFEELGKTKLDEAIEKDDDRPDIEVSRDMPELNAALLGPYWASPWISSSSYNP
jgi:hypothetical protein